MPNLKKIKYNNRIRDNNLTLSFMVLISCELNNNSLFKG